MPAAPAEQRGEAQGSHQAIVRSPQVPQRLRSFSAGEPSAPMPGSCGTGRTMLVTHPQPLAHPSPPRRDAPAPPFPTIQLQCKNARLSHRKGIFNSDHGYKR